MEIFFHSHLDSNTLIAIKFCIWHDGSVVVAGTKIVTIWWSTTELQDGKVSVEFKLREKIVSETDPRPQYASNVFVTNGRKKQNTNLNIFLYICTLFSVCNHDNPTSTTSSHERPWKFLTECWCCVQWAVIYVWEVSYMRICLTGFWAEAMKYKLHDYVIKWKHFPRYGPLNWGFTGHIWMTRSFDIFFGIHMNKWFSKQSRRWWFENPSRSLWRRRNVKK